MATRKEEEEQAKAVLARRSDLGDDPLDPTAGAGRVRERQVRSSSQKGRLFFTWLCFWLFVHQADDSLVKENHRY